MTALPEKSEEACINCMHWKGDGNLESGKCHLEEHDIITVSPRDNCGAFMTKHLPTNQLHLNFSDSVTVKSNR